MKKQFYLIALLALIANISFGQINMTTSGSHVQNFDALISTGTGTWTDNNTIANWYSQKTGTGNVITAGTGSSNAGGLFSYGSTASTERALGSLGSTNAAAGSFAHGVLLRNISGTTITNITVAYTGEQWRNGGAANVQTIAFFYKKSTSTITALNPNVNTTWTPVSSLDFPSPIATGAAATLDGNLAANKTVIAATAIPSLSLADNEYIMLKWDDPDQTGADHGLSIDDVTISWTVSAATTPTITLNTTTPTAFNGAFGNVNVGSSSASSPFTVSGSNLTNDIIVTPPAGGFEIRTGANAFSTNAITLTQTGGTVAETVIDARFTPAAAGAQSGDITLNSTGATNKTVAVSGTGIAACAGAPTSQAAFGTTTPDINATIINLTSGTGGTGRVLKINIVNSFTDITDGSDPTTATSYSGSSEQVVFNGTGLGPITITNLLPNTPYYYAVYEYNCIAGRFYLNPAATTTVTTLPLPPSGLQVTATNQVFKIDFDNTVANTNVGSFNGNNINTGAASGSLNSNAWSISGVSATAAATFGGTTTGTLGVINGGTTSSGNFFAMNIGTGNVALGVQPTGAYFSPGNITLKIQNKTGVPITNLDLSNILYVVNDQDRSSSFNLAYSTDNVTYSNLPVADYTSVAALQNTNVRAQYRSYKISSLNVATDGFVYLRWSSDDVGGSGSRDEFAIDDIQVIANASSFTPTINGVFEDVLISSLTETTGATTVSGNFNLVSGNLNTTSFPLTLAATATVTGGSSTSFVNGPLTRNTLATTSFLFPVGKGSSYRPVSVIPAAATASVYVAEYFNSTSPTGTYATAVTGVASNEYWDVSRSSGSDAQIQLTYDATNTWTNGAPTVSDNIAVAHLVGGQWIGENGDVLPGLSAGGTLKTKVLSTFSPFTFGFGPATILPLNITSFTAVKTNNGNLISWTTANEVNVQRMLLERSMDGRNFSQIATINAGNSNYSFTDATPVSTTNYYRLKIVDKDGTSKLSKVVAVINKGKGAIVTGVYPTITTGKLTIDVAVESTQNLQFVFTDLQGRTTTIKSVTAVTGNNIISLDASALANGMYLVKMLQGNNEATSFKIVKQ
jgi:Secretion system C-terminal sorting domain